MVIKTRKTKSQILTDIIIHGIQEKKGKNIVSLNLTKIPNAVCNFFIICHGTSKVQVESIADSVIYEVKKVSGANPWHKEGFKNAEWILIDYFYVVVHVFQENTRDFYRLENLWADAEIQKFKNDE